MPTVPTQAPPVHRQSEPRTARLDALLPGAPCISVRGLQLVDVENLNLDLVAKLYRAALGDR